MIFDSNALDECKRMRFYFSYIHMRLLHTYICARKRVSGGIMHTQEIEFKLRKSIKIFLQVSMFLLVLNISIFDNTDIRSQIHEFSTQIVFWNCVF